MTVEKRDDCPRISPFLSCTRTFTYTNPAGWVPRVKEGIKWQKKNINNGACTTILVGYV